MKHEFWIAGFAFGLAVLVIAGLFPCSAQMSLPVMQTTATGLPSPVFVEQSDWKTVAADPEYTRSSPQTVIGKDNVDTLQVKWILHTGYPVENPPLIVGNTVYLQNNALQIIAVDLATGLSKWKYDPHVVSSGGLPRASSSHGMSYNLGTIYAPTGPNGTIVALNAATGAKVWESDVIDIGPAWRESAPPIIWKNIIVAGSALGDEPPFGVAQKGTVTGLDLATGKKIWQTQLAVGDWVTTSPNASQNGGATTWSGGAVDTEKGVIFLPIGNPSPDFQPDLRPGPNDYANHVIALRITDGKILWSTPFVAEGSVMRGFVTPDGHDWDCSWGTNLVTMNGPNGPQKVVIGHDKRGDVMAMDANTGKPIWWVNLINTKNNDQNPTPSGTDVVVPGPGAGIEAFTATDGKKVYAAATETAVRYYTGPPTSGSTKLLEGGSVPDYGSYPNGYGVGSVAAIDINTGKIVWQYHTDNPTFVSPLVTNGVVFSGYMTDTGTPFAYSDFGGVTDSPLLPSGYIMALDADSGTLLWKFNVGGQVGIGGPSIGNGYLIVPTGGIQEYTQEGAVIAFGVP